MKESKDMEAMTMLDRISTAVERVLKDARPVRKEMMGPEALAAYAMAQIQKAAAEPAESAVRRLAALAKAVEVAKQAFVDTASEQIEVELFEEETTARADASEKELSPVAVEAALGSSGFAANAEDLNKALAHLAKDIEALRVGPPQADPLAKGVAAEWPFDMNSREFREGVRKAEDAPDWGFDPGRDAPKA
jgi:hypothetical protein